MLPISPMTYIKVGLLVAVLGLFYVQNERVHHYKTALAEEKAERAKEKADQEKVVRKHTEQIAAIRAEHATKQQETSDAYQQLQQQLQAARTAHRARTDSVRQSLEAATASGGAGPATDAVACQRDQDRLEALGRLASEGLGLLEEGRDLLAEREGQVTYLLNLLANDRAAVGQAHSSSTTQPEP